MGPAPTLATYESQAKAVYAPQEKAEATALQTTDTTTKATLEAEKPQIQTDYQSAIDTLTQSTQTDMAKIDQLYTTNLGGNFSGLEGNDMGQLFAKTNEQQGIIAATEANSLAQITSQEGNADITYKSSLAALKPKYQSEEAQYAQTNYADAVKEYNTEAHQNAELSLSEARLGISEAKAASSSSNGGLTASELLNYEGKFKVSSLSSGNKSYTGPNGQTNLYQYAVGSNGPNASKTDVYNTILSELKTGSSTDKAAYNKVANLSTSAGIKYLQQHNSYIFN